MVYERWGIIMDMVIDGVFVGVFDLCWYKFNRVVSMWSGIWGSVVDYVWDR